VNLRSSWLRTRPLPSPPKAAADEDGPGFADRLSDPESERMARSSGLLPPMTPDADLLSAIAHGACPLPFYLSQTGSPYQTAFFLEG